MQFRGIFMRIIKADIISREVPRLAVEANYFLGSDMRNALQKGLDEEKSEVGKEIFQQLINNANIAAKEKMPICQDTGFAVVFIDIGNEVHIDGDIYDAVNKGISQGYKDGYLRKSIVENPFDRVNTGNNTPAVVHLRFVPGDKVKIIVAPKGGGSENMSKINMLKPADGIEGVVDFVLNTVDQAGANPCPPIIVGVGIGGTFEKAALLAKRSLLRPINDRNSDEKIAELEDELLKKVNQLGIGPLGLGGIKTALSVKIEIFPCHIASLPVAVNLNCHAARHKECII